MAELDAPVDALDNENCGPEGRNLKFTRRILTELEGRSIGLKGHDRGTGRAAG